MSLAEVLEATADLSLDESLPTVISALKVNPIVLPLAKKPEPNEASLQMLVANDNDGHPWVYLYSSEESAAAAGITGYYLAHVPFEQVLKVMSGFRGIVIDSHKPRGCFLIPAELFQEMAAQLGQVG